MLVYRNKYLGLRAIQVCWPQTAGVAREFLDQAPVVILVQCPKTLAPALRAWVFRQHPFQTPLINLTLTEEQLWQNLSKVCRYEVRKAQKLRCAISCNEDIPAARLLINDSIRRLGYRSEPSDGEWQFMESEHDIFLCREQGIPVAAHVMRCDPPGRARLLLSGGADRGDERLRGIIGPCNRLLHWHEFQHYKAKGFSAYDFGGCDTDPASPSYSISQFKLSFGGEVVVEPTMYLAKNLGLRAVLRARGAVLRGLRRIPWPNAWLRALRTRASLADLFR